MSTSDQQTDNETLSLRDILVRFELIGMAVAVAIGIAGKDLIFSLSNNLLIPGAANIVVPESVLKGNHHWNFKFDLSSVVSNVLTFAVVVGVILILLNTVLRRFVQEKVSKVKKTEEAVDKAQQTRQETLDVLKKHLAATCRESN